jgi:hypothetical protein
MRITSGTAAVAQRRSMGSTSQARMWHARASFALRSTQSLSGSSGFFLTIQAGWHPRLPGLYRAIRIDLVESRTFCRVFGII